MSPGDLHLFVRLTSVIHNRSKDYGWASSCQSGFHCIAKDLLFTDMPKVPIAGNVVSVILQMVTFAILAICLRKTA